MLKTDGARFVGKILVFPILAARTQKDGNKERN